MNLKIMNKNHERTNLKDERRIAYLHTILKNDPSRINYYIINKKC